MGNRAQALENLKKGREKGKQYRWKPGQSGHPSGRATDEAGRIARTIFDEVLPSHLLDRLNKVRGGPKFAQGTRIGECILAAMAFKAMKGDVDAAKVFLTRAFGSVEKNKNLVVSGNLNLQHANSIESIRVKLQTLFSGSNSQDGSDSDELAQRLIAGGLKLPDYEPQKEPPIIDVAALEPVAVEEKAE